MVLTGQTVQTDKVVTTAETEIWRVVPEVTQAQDSLVETGETVRLKVIRWYYGLPGILMQEKDLMLIPVSPETEPVQEQAVQADKEIRMLCLHRFAFL